MLKKKRSKSLNNLSKYTSIFKKSLQPNKSVPRHCLRQYRLNLAVQGKGDWF
jgi:hypothetical protein